MANVNSCLAGCLADFALLRGMDKARFIIMSGGGGGVVVDRRVVLLKSCCGFCAGDDNGNSILVD